MAIREALAPLARRQFFRFLVVGAVNTLFSYLVYAGLIFVGLNFALANLGAVALGVLFSFKTQGVFVFNNRSQRVLLRYVALWLIVYLCNIALIKYFLAFQSNAYLAGALALGPIVVLSYLLQKHVVFKSSAPPER